MIIGTCSRCGEIDINLNIANVIIMHSSEPAFAMKTFQIPP